MRISFDPYLWVLGLVGFAFVLTMGVMGRRINSYSALHAHDSYTADRIRVAAVKNIGTLILVGGICVALVLIGWRFAGNAKPYMYAYITGSVLGFPFALWIMS